MKIPLALAVSFPLLGAIAVPALGQEQPQPIVQELFLGENPYPQDRGSLQLIGDATYRRAPGEGEFALQLTAEYGITDRLQLGARAPYRFLNPDQGPTEHGVGDVGLSALYNFQRSPDLVLSGFLEVSLPTGDEDDGLGEGEWVFRPLLLAAKRFGPAEVYLNVGAELSNGEASFLYDVAAAYPVESFAAVLELNGSAGHADEHYLTPGVYWRESDKLQVGVGVPVGFGADADDYRVVLRVVYEP